MRAIISAVVLLSLCTALVLANAIALCDILTQMTELCDKISREQESPQELRELFVEHRSLLALSIESDELERLGELIESLVSAYESKDSSQTVKYCRLTADLCRELSSFEKISIESIF